MTSIKSKDKKWITLSEKTVWSHPVVSLKEKFCQSSEDATKNHTFYVMNSGEWANILAVTSRKTIVLVRQYRIGNEKMMVEFPGGIADPGDLSIEHSALRELREETGYVPLPEAKCEWLGSSYSNPAIFNNKVHSFIVGPVEKLEERQLDHGELMDTVEVSLEEFQKLVRRDEFQHALMQITYYHLLMKGERARLEALAFVENFHH